MTAFPGHEHASTIEEQPDSPFARRAYFSIVMTSGAVVLGSSLVEIVVRPPGLLLVVLALATVATSDEDDTGAAAYMRLSGTSMATAVTTGIVALMIEQHRRSSNLPLTANQVKAVLQFTAIPVNGSDVLTQGAGAVNPPGALALVAALANARGPASERSVVQANTTIGSQTYAWNQAVVWGNTYVYGDVIHANALAWASSTTWGSAIVWEYGWAASGDLVWDSASTWSTNTIWDPIPWPLGAGEPWPDLAARRGVIWGHGDN